MKKSEYTKNNSDWFSNKKAKLNITLRNRGGTVIYAGEDVVISGKYGRGGFNIVAAGKRYIKAVNYEFVDLIESN